MLSFNTPSCKWSIVEGVIIIMLSFIELSHQIFIVQYPFKVYLRPHELVFNRLLLPLHIVESRDKLFLVRLATHNS